MSSIEADGVGGVEVGDGAGDAEDLVVGAGQKAQLRHFGQHAALDLARFGGDAMHLNEAINYRVLDRQMWT